MRPAMKINKAKLEQRKDPPAGYVQAVEKAATSFDGVCYHLTDEAWEKIQQDYLHGPIIRRPARFHGLGDAVAYVAHPVARIADKVLGTNLQGCGGCRKRQEALNR